MPTNFLVTFSYWVNPFFRFSVQLAATKRCGASRAKFWTTELWNYFWRKIQNVWNRAERFLTWQNRSAENTPKTRFWRTCSRCRSSASRKRRWCATTWWRQIWTRWSRRSISTTPNQKDTDSDSRSETDTSKTRTPRAHVEKRSESEWKRRIEDLTRQGKMTNFLVCLLFC